MARAWLIHDVLIEELQVSDHVYKWGSPVHTHHGLVVEILEAPSPRLDTDGDDLLDRIIVLHLSFNGPEAEQAKVHRVPLRTSLTNGLKGSPQRLKRARYGVSRAEHALKLPGTCYSMQADAPETVLRRAHLLLDASQSQPYDLHSLTSANCEHVIVWCKTGVWQSSQVDGAFNLMRAAALAAGVAAACRAPTARGLLPLLGGIILWKASVPESPPAGNSGGFPSKLVQADRGEDHENTPTDMGIGIAHVAHQSAALESDHVAPDTTARSSTEPDEEPVDVDHEKPVDSAKNPDIKDCAVSEADDASDSEFVIVEDTRCHCEASRPNDT